MTWNPPASAYAGSIPVGDAKYPIPAGVVLYVSPSGDNANSGTVNSPKRTVAAAIATAPSGATIVLRSGEYHESVTVPSTKALTIQAYPGETVWFDGSRRYWAWSGSGPWTSSLGVDWSPIESARYGQAGDGRAHYPEQIWINNAALTQIEDGARPGAGQFSIDRTANTITVGTNPRGRNVRVAELRRWMLATGPVKLLGFGVRRYSPAAIEGPDSALIYVAGASYNSVIQNVVFRQSGMHGLSIVRPITLDQITVEECSNTGIQMTTAQNSVLSRFAIRNCNRGGWKAQPITAGIKITRTDGLVIRDGIVENVPGCVGVWFDVSNTRFAVVNVSVNKVSTGFETELSGGGKIGGVQYRSWLVNCRTANVVDWSVQILDSDHVTVANCDLAGGRVSVNLQQDRPANTGSPSNNLTFETVPWVSVHNRLLNNRITSQPAIAGVIAYHDPPQPVRDPDGGPARILLGWDFFDRIEGNWFRPAPPGSMVQLGRVDGHRTSYNTPTALAASPSTVGVRGGKLGPNHQGATAPDHLTAVPLTAELAALTGAPEGLQHVGAFLPAPTSVYAPPTGAVAGAAYSTVPSATAEISGNVSISGELAAQM